VVRLGVGTVLVRRAIALTVALVIVVILTAVILGASGYDVKIWQALIHEQLRAYQMQLQRSNVPPAKVKQLVSEYKERLIKLYGLDKPWYERFWPLVSNTLTFNLGISESYDVADVAGVPYPVRVGDAIMRCLPRTIVMITIAQLICAAAALYVGPFIAYRRGTMFDRAIVSYSALTNAIPVWWLGMILIFFLSYRAGIFPTDFRSVVAYINNFWRNPLMNLVQIFYYASLPIITIVIAFLGSWFYTVRAMVLRVVREDFVIVAKAKGLPERYIASKHVLRAAAPPVVTNVILSLAASLSGYIITESVFNWPGMGTLYWVAIRAADLPTILGLTYAFTLVYILARFILEVLYIFLDPRVRYR